MSVIAKISGGCHCGAVRFEADGKWRKGTACHCSQCRSQTGSFYMTSGIKKEDFKIIKDEGLAWYQASKHAERGFCSKCGSALFWRSVDAEWVATEYITVMLGAMDDTQGVKIEKHIYCSEKGDYYDIADDLPKADIV